MQKYNPIRGSGWASRFRRQEAGRQRVSRALALRRFRHEGRRALRLGVEPQQKVSVSQ